MRNGDPKPSKIACIFTQTLCYRPCGSNAPLIVFSSFLCPHNTFFFLAEEEGRSFEDIEQNQTIMTLGLVGEKCLTVESSLNHFSPAICSKRC